MRKTFILDKGWRFSPETIKKYNQSHIDSYATSKAGGCSGPAGISYDDSKWRLLDMCHPNKNGHRKASKNGMNRILSFVFERRPHLFHGSLDNEPLPT